MIYTKFIFLLFFATLIFAVSCHQDVQDVMESTQTPPFEARDVVQVLENEPATVRYYCGEDTSFVYLRLEQEPIEDLLIHSVSFLDSLFLDRNLYINDASGACRPDFLFQNMHIPLLVSGKVVAFHKRDTLPDGFYPFVWDSFEKVVCEVDSVHMDTQIDRLTGSWSIYRFVDDDNVVFPPCEINDLTFQFHDRRVFEYYDDNKEWYHLDGPFNGCFFGYALNSVQSDSMFFTPGECILGWSNSTREFYQFQIYMLKFLGWGDSEVAGFGMRLEDNWLTIESSESRIELFKKE